MQAPWLYLHSYRFAGEGPEETKALIKELLSLDIAMADMSWPEDKAKPGSEAAVGLGKVAQSSEGRPPLPFGLQTGRQALIIATVICVISCLVSYMLATKL